MQLENFKKFQVELAKKIKLLPLKKEPRYVAGVDVGYLKDKNIAQAVWVILTYPEFEILEIENTIGKPSFPYIPGFLAFREIPLILDAFKKLRHIPELIFVDGQGIAHPRKAGVAVHLGVELEIPTIGCAKKPFLKVDLPAEPYRGAKSPILLDGEVVGYALRTQNKVNPIFVSPGNLITLEEAVKWTLNTAIKHRQPEPLRLAHQFSKRISVGDIRNDSSILWFETR